MKQKLSVSTRVRLYQRYRHVRLKAHIPCFRVAKRVAAKLMQSMQRCRQDGKLGKLVVHLQGWEQRKKLNKGRVKEVHGHSAVYQLKV